jgi:hypothetical protein
VKVIDLDGWAVRSNPSINHQPKENKEKNRREVGAVPFYKAGEWAKKYLLKHDAPFF